MTEICFLTFFFRNRKKLQGFEVDLARSMGVALVFNASNCW